MWHKLLQEGKVRKKQSIWVILALLLITRPSVAQMSVVDVPNVQDPAKAEILSLRLYMTGQQAVAALKKRFPTARLSNSALVRNSILIFRQKTPEGHEYIGGLSYSTEQFSVLVGLVPDFPFNPARPEILADIVYRPTLRTAADQQFFYDELLKKYGSPLSQNTPVYAAWCAKGRGDENHPPKACNAGLGPILEFVTPQLRLQDTEIGDRLAAKREQQRTIAKPIL